MGAVTGAQILCFYRYLKAILRDFGFGIIGCRHLKRLAKHCSHFSCHTENTLAVRTVCGKRNIKNPVIQSGDFLYIIARIYVFGKHQ